MSGGDLVARVDSPLPASLPAGQPVALFCMGECFHEAAVRDLVLLVDGAPCPPAASGMPGATHRRGAWWGTLPVPARPAGAVVELAAAARLADGGEAVAPLARIPVAPPPPPPPGGEGRVAVCMATCDPEPALFRAQVESLRAQTDDRWLCVISDDASTAERCAAIERAVAGDPRFTFSRAATRSGFYGNFERALRMAPAGCELIALCDQDDVWHPDKLAVLRSALGGALMAYSDQRLVDRAGRVLRETLWTGRRNNHTSLASLLVANTVTGAATLFRREVAELALPFPDAPGVQFHDHWLALVALAAGDVAYVDRPLYDYVQHGNAVFGELAAGENRRRRWRGGRSAYFIGYLGREVLARTLLLRCAGRLAPGKRRDLERFAAADRSAAALAWLALRPARALAGRNETLGTEAGLAHGLLWRRAASALAAAGRPVEAGFPDEGSFQQPRLERWRRAGAS